MAFGRTYFDHDAERGGRHGCQPAPAQQGNAKRIDTDWAAASIPLTNKDLRWLPKLDISRKLLSAVINLSYGNAPTAAEGHGHHSESINGDTLTAALPLDYSNFRLSRNLVWRDPDTDFQFALSQPSTDPALWNEYVDGAKRSYQNRGVECALDLDALQSGDDTVLFFTALDRAGRIVGGARSVGPLQSPDESHAVVEWSGQEGQQRVWDMIADRLPFGVLEIKTAWKLDCPGKNRELTEVLARTGFHMTALLDVQFFMATSASYLVDKWRTSGGVVAPVPETPYPDDRFNTKMMWWDSRNFAQFATPDQASKIHNECTRLLHAFYRETQPAPSTRSDS